MCHLLLFFPVFGLFVFYVFPPGEAVIVYSFILLFSGIIYRWIWRTQCRPATTGVEGMLGGVGRVIEVGKRTAKIFYRGEIWNAASADPLSVGDSVEIVSLARMTLTVRKVVAGQVRQTISFSCH